jgi:D-lactate dehydrogenase
MKVTIFSSKPYDRQFLDVANNDKHELRYLDCRLSVATAALAKGSAAVCLFASDEANATTIMAFAHMGIRLIALRSAGFNNVDLAAATAHGITVARVPAYSPHAVAEHTFALILSLVRKIPRAYNRVREGNFSLEGLMGFDLAGKTLGIIGAGNIGSVVAQIAHGFGCEILVSDPVRRADVEALGGRYVPLETLLDRSDIVTLHCPLNDSSRHLIDASALERMKPAALLINTSRGAVVDTHAVIGALKRQRLGGLAIDVYEEEDRLFFEDRSEQPILDDQFARLLTFPNVLVTGHQGFFTFEALTNIAATTIANLDSFEESGCARHEVTFDAPATVAREQIISGVPA